MAVRHFDALALFRVPAYQVIGYVAMTVAPIAHARVWVAATTLDCVAREFRILGDVSLLIPNVEPVEVV